MQLNFPAYNFNIKRQENANYVFDIIRKKFVMLTPEEWVRQHLLHYLIQDKKYPASLLAVERGLIINKRRKRFDVLAFQADGKPALLVECKSPEIQINPQALRQVALYNSQFGCKHLLVTNGLRHLHFTMDTDGSSLCTEGIPFYTEIT